MQRPGAQLGRSLKKALGNKNLPTDFYSWSDIAPQTARRGAPATQLNIMNDQASPVALIGRREATLALVYIRGINSELFILIKICPNMV